MGLARDPDVFLPLERNPTWMSLASMMILGRRKQKEDTRWMKAAVGPPWCHAFLKRPIIFKNVRIE